jgi:hypothetical protein
MESTVAGIPCRIQVDRFHIQKPMGPRADSDWDCYGYTDIDFTVCDRRGRPAPWLAKKLTDSDTQRINTEIKEAHHDRNH